MNYRVEYDESIISRERLENKIKESVEAITPTAICKFGYSIDKNGEYKISTIYITISELFTLSVNTILNNIVNYFKQATDSISIEQIPDWNKTFMDVAKVISKRSKDPKAQVGAVIVSDNRILSTGYNGLPNGCDDNVFPWNRDVCDRYNSKDGYVIHAEMNAILHVERARINDNTVIYVSKFPCPNCTQAIIQIGIKNIIFEDDKLDEECDDYLIATRMLEASGVSYHKI